MLAVTRFIHLWFLNYRVAQDNLTRVCPALKLCLKHYWRTAANNFCRIDGHKSNLHQLESIAAFQAQINPFIRSKSNIRTPALLLLQVKPQSSGWNNRHTWTSMLHFSRRICPLLLPTSPLSAPFNNSSRLSPVWWNLQLTFTLKLYKFNIRLIRKI